jgi:hypothetical protein
MKLELSNFLVVFFFFFFLFLVFTFARRSELKMGRWHLPTIPELCKYVIVVSVVDFLVFFYAGTAGFFSDTTVVVVFSWLSLALLFVALTMVVNGFLIRRELLVYFLSLYIRLFGLAFQLIALGIGVTHSSTFSAVFTFTLIGLVIVVELVVYGFLLVQLDDLSAAEAEEVPQSHG